MSKYPENLELKNSIVIFLLLIILWSEDDFKKRKNQTLIAERISKIFSKLGYNHKTNRIDKKEKKEQFKISSNTIKHYINVLRKENLLEIGIQTNDVYYFPFEKIMENLLLENKSKEHDIEDINKLIREFKEDSNNLKRKCLDFIYYYKEKDLEFTKIIKIMAKSDFLIDANFKIIILFLFSLFDSFKIWINNYNLLNDIVYEVHSYIWDFLFDQDMPILTYFEPYPSFENLNNFFTSQLLEKQTSKTNIEAFFTKKGNKKQNKIAGIFFAGYLPFSLTFAKTEDEKRLKEKFELDLKKYTENYFKEIELE